MSEWFKFGSVDSRAYSADAFELHTYNAPSRSYDARQVPGRNGDFLLDRGRFSNVEHAYSCIIHDNLANNLTGFRNALLSQRGYQRLEDSMHAGEFYLAYYNDALSPILDERRTMGKMTIVFTRKPQRFLKTGEQVTTLTASGTINNPTLFESRPLLRVYGTGTVGIGSGAISIISSEDYVDIDCDMMEAYRGTESYNSLIEVLDNRFPVLAPGSNGITLEGGITRVDITPRWYRL